MIIIKQKCKVDLKNKIRQQILDDLNLKILKNQKILL